MPASLIIIAALTCFILWFRFLLLSIALGYDLQWQVLEVRRQPLITASAGGGWNVLVGCRWRAPTCSWGTCCQVSSSQEGTDWDLPIPSCPDDLSCPSPPILFLLPALPSIRSPCAKIFTSCLNHFFILKVIFFGIGAIGCTEAGPRAMWMLIRRQPLCLVSCGAVLLKRSTPALLPHPLCLSH